jgi:hypothetical protein
MNSQEIANIVAKLLTTHKLDDLVVGEYPTTKFVELIETYGQTNLPVVTNTSIWPTVLPKQTHLANEEIVTKLQVNPSELFKQYKDLSIPKEKRSVLMANGKRYTVFLPSNKAVKIFITQLLANKKEAANMFLALQLSTRFYYTTTDYPKTIGNYFEEGTYKGLLDEIYPYIKNQDVVGLKTWLATWDKAIEAQNYTPSRYKQ